MRTLYALNKVAGRQAGYGEEAMKGDIVEVESQAGRKGFITADSLLATLRKKNGNVAWSIYLFVQCTLLCTHWSLFLSREVITMTSCGQL